MAQSAALLYYFLVIDNGLQERKMPSNRFLRLSVLAPMLFALMLFALSSCFGEPGRHYGKGYSIKFPEGWAIEEIT